MRVVPWIVMHFIQLWPFRGHHGDKDHLALLPSYEWSPFDPEKKPRTFLQIPTDEQLMTLAYARSLASEVRELGINRRHFYDWVADEIYGFQGLYIGADGKPVDPDKLPETEASFHLEERWVDDFFSWADREPKQAIQRKIVPRLRLVAMARDAFRNRHVK